MEDIELRQEILKAIKKGWVVNGGFRTDEAVHQVFKMVKEKLNTPVVVKSFTAEQVGDMLSKDFTTIEEAIAYFDSIK
jgi:hypothetical protein